MSADARLKVVLCWHMHQPQYRDLISGAYHLPWTYLHAIKDYVDMAAHLEAHPSARAVINLAPLLLEQIEDYAGQVDGFLSNSRAIRDPLLASLAAPLPADAESRLGLIKACLRANETRMIQRFAPYRRLAEMAKWLCAHTDGLSYLSDQFLADLLAWHHLAWLGETVRRTDARVKRLLEKGAQYTLHDRRELLAVIGELLTNILPRYARLAGSGTRIRSFPCCSISTARARPRRTRPCRCSNATRAERSGRAGTSSAASRRSASTSATPRRAAGRPRARSARGP